jgi:outer membrane protein assembly factor BamA
MLFRIKLVAPFELALLTLTRYESPSVNAGSKLADDLTSGAVIGARPSLLQTFGFGAFVDTRDSEFFPTRGVFYTAGFGGTLGSAEHVRFVEASAAVSHFATLTRWLIFANRLIGSLRAGVVPFYELQQGGVFDPQYLVGGNAGLRGVRLGRYAGLAKVIANEELRFIPIPRFRVLRWSVLAGATLLFDAGRVWSDYAVRPAADGTTLGLKYGVGTGVFFQWDQATVVRIEGVYSPDQPDRPLSFYFQAGFQF